jgi:hypothetical protein
MTKIKNFPENARITFLGSIFKERKNPECYINIGLENYKYSIDFRHKSKNVQFI